MNGIQDISKIEAGKFALDEAPVKLGGMMDDVCSMLAERARAKGLALSVDCRDVPDGLQGYPTRLQLALLNHATNAVKFTDSGSVTLRAQVQDQGCDRVLMRFEVTDTGIGIAPEARDRLFMAFELADSTTARKYGGSGLGSAITRRLAKLMGGEAGVVSTLGGGSTFRFTARLAMTADVFVEDRERCLEAGMSDFLGKPFNPAALYLVLLKGLDATAAWGRPAHPRGHRRSALSRAMLPGAQFAPEASFEPRCPMDPA